MQNKVFNKNEIVAGLETVNNSNGVSLGLKAREINALAAFTTKMSDRQLMNFKEFYAIFSQKEFFSRAVNQVASEGMKGNEKLV